MYRDAAQQGNIDAKFGLGYLYYVGYNDGEDIFQSYELAAEWFREAADQGHDESQYYLGRMYESGEGVIENIDEAMKWYKKAADQGNAYAEEAIAIQNDLVKLRSTKKK